jgi:hypothetical protein
MEPICDEWPARQRYLMQNLGEEFEQFRSAPSREELNHMLSLPK